MLSQSVPLLPEGLSQDAFPEPSEVSTFPAAPPDGTARGGVPWRVSVPVMKSPLLETLSSAAYAWVTTPWPPSLALLRARPGRTFPERSRAHYSAALVEPVRRSPDLAKALVHPRRRDRHRGHGQRPGADSHRRWERPRLRSPPPWLEYAPPGGTGKCWRRGHGGHNIRASQRHRRHRQRPGDADGGWRDPYRDAAPPRLENTAPGGTRQRGGG